MEYSNHLVGEKSPYLQQHAHNPVDWYPWGDEAFAEARRRDVPIFLSIGYSTCHWCHVMERESFEDPSLAAYLNAHFVAIKVDREERPDIDDVYMGAVQAISGGGGWPMTVFLTPALAPFYGGTYFPPESSYGRPGFRALLERIAELWGHERDSLLSTATEVLGALKGDRSATRGTGSLSQVTVDGCYQYLERSFDSQYGGFGGAPKFPRPAQLDFLLQYGWWTGVHQADTMALTTLRRRSAGAMHDQVGGGFHRYSVDRYWGVPHFEKMLYDQAQLAQCYLDGYLVSGEVAFRRVCKRICTYVLRDLLAPEGGFYSAEDADSDGEEGQFYAWTSQELETVLGADYAVCRDAFGVSDGGNFEGGKNLLFRTKPLEEVAKDAGLMLSDVERAVHDALDRLLAVRASRIRPARDEKIVTAWNALMIGALARAGATLGNEEFLSAATRAGTWIWDTMVSPTGLARRYCDGECKHDGVLEDYAFCIRGFLSLYQATFDRTWLDRAISLQAMQEQKFWDDEVGGYFASAERADVILRKKSDYDGAEPSGNSVAVGNLLTLFVITEESGYRQRADALLRSFQQTLQTQPWALPLMQAELLRWLSPSRQLVLAGSDADVSALQRVAFERYEPALVLMRAGSTPSKSAEAFQSDSNGASAYYCRDFACQLPVHTADALRLLLETSAPSRRTHDDA